MSQTDRIVRIRALLDQRRAVSRRTLLDTLEISAATLKRDIAFLRDVMNIPIRWDRELGGYRLEPAGAAAPDTSCRVCGFRSRRRQLFAGALVRGSPGTVMDIVKHGSQCEVLKPEGLGRILVAEAGNLAARSENGK